ncbi:hypothetical protein ACJQWK_06599 [Exserohilum turcicum]|uniref:Uncharacterized protein n=1 Tax=Exserohilum turcicum (strain 28A) TaxID=671987 RepID=R0K7E6_EXST2|nr:uncharacterized protein SETTUDRAFT_90147 [Exserohilum turcica Et28A]EOA85454.1 hypothetical protein SETTUDRAFT_90147 [Exserohilum turcica Et28A]
MHFSIMHALTLALFGGLVTADCCKNGLDYCGYGLLNKGNYYGEIQTALERAGLPVDPDHVRYTLFHCGACTDTPVVRYCGVNRCTDGGSGHSDYCS